jgi:DNA mismatch repair ATPase MutS
LRGMADRLAANHNVYFALLAPFLLWKTRIAFEVEAWRAARGARIESWIDVIAEVEALASVASYAYECPADPFAEIDTEGVSVEAVGLGHPLLPVSKSVRNDLSLGGPGSTRVLVVSGSNMSGKSTWLRTVGVNVVLAQAGVPVRAVRMRVSPLSIGATLRVQDSLQSGASRFYAEIKRIKQVVDLASGPRPLLFLLDEILHGTNSHDRRQGAEAIVRGLLDRGAIGLITTHDLALADIAEGLSPLATNVHFADAFDGGTLHFDYTMRPGVVRESNALALMRSVGLAVGEAGPTPGESWDADRK